MSHYPISACRICQRVTVSAFECSEIVMEAVVLECLRAFEGPSPGMSHARCMLLCMSLMRVHVHVPGKETVKPQPLTE